MRLSQYSLKELIETPDLDKGFKLSYEEFRELCKEVGITVEGKIKRLFNNGNGDKAKAYSPLATPPLPELRRHFESELYVAAKRMRDLNKASREYKVMPSLSIYSYDLKVPYMKGEYNILQISDIHFKKTWPQRVMDLATLVNAVNIKPDVIICTGDVIHEQKSDFRPDAYFLMRDMFPGIKKLYVLGNHDYEDNASRLVRAKMDHAGWANVTDSLYRARSSKGSLVNIYGVGMPGFHKSIVPHMRGKEKDTNILLTHSLDALHSGFPGCWDAVLSGHLHAGEMDLWFFDGVDYLMKVGKYSNLNEQKKGWKALSRRTMSYISPGLATHSLMRFNTDTAGITLIRLVGE